MDNNSLTNYLKAQKKLKQAHQSHLLELFPSLLKEEQDALIQEILTLDLNRLKKIQTLFSNPATTHRDIHPFTDLIPSGCMDKKKLGLEALAQGKCACLLIAGGQGTRLNHYGPKGTYPIAPITNKSLFQIFCEKVKRASRLVKRDLPLVIMTSPLNDATTRSFFISHQYFGLKKEQVIFFSQSMLPLLDLNGKLFLNQKTQIAFGPDGNGGCFNQMHDQRISHTLKNCGIQYLNVILVDNPLAEPYDPELFGELISSQSDISIKSCTRLSPEEKVGVIVQEKGLPVIVEYHEVSKDFHFEKEPAANLGLFALTLDFVDRIAKKHLPLHKVLKKSPYFDLEEQVSKFPTQPNCWKFESYIFDILPYSEKTTVLTYPRKDIFCPLKNKEGDYSPHVVRKSLLEIGIK